MPREPVWSRVLRETTLPLGAVLGILLAATEVVFDFTTWIELNVSILYGLPLILAASARSRRLVWGLAAVLVASTFVVYSLQRSPGPFSPADPFFLNRVLASVAVFTIASLLTVWMKAADTMDAQGRALKDQNERLEAANALITEQNDELERRRREAEDASGRKSRLLRSVSHDMRSPINAITMMAEVIRRRAGDPALATDVPGLAQRLQSNAASLNELVTNVLDVSALETGRIAFHASEFSLNELLSEVGAQLLNVAQAKRLKLTVQVPEATIRLRADRTALMRVITNLLTNAIKFTDRGGVVVVAELMPDRAVEIRVQDTGVGIAADDLKHLFEDFARFEGAGAPQGWGLGLAICRRLVEMIGGTITAASESNVGSVFTVTLPATCVLDREPRVAGGPAA